MAPTPTLERGLRVVQDPLTGSIPTWRMDDERLYWETVEKCGDPARAAVDARIVHLPAAAGDVVVGVVDEAATS